MTSARINKSYAPVLKVNVLAHHIDCAIRLNSNSCMIAEAIKELYPKFSHVAVDLQSIRMTDREKGVRYIYLTPRVAQVALVLFDKGKRMRPISFTLKGAHTVAAYVVNRQKGKPVRERVKLGRRRIIANSDRDKPSTIGGKPPPRHPSSSGLREFGMRAFTEEDVSEVGKS